MKHIIPLTDAAPDVDWVEADYPLTDEMVEALAVIAPTPRGGAAMRQNQRSQMLKRFFEGEDDGDETAEGKTG